MFMWGVICGVVGTFVLLLLIVILGSWYDNRRDRRLEATEKRIRFTEP